MTYSEVGIKHGLSGKKLSRYVKYMNERWADSEDSKTKTGYAGEWAERFKNNSEYDRSDSIGRAVLDRIDKLD